jgi:hypothetical protein
VKRSGSLRLGLRCLVGLLAGTTPCALLAQDFGRTRLGTVENPNEVLARPRLDYDTQGFDVGSFTVTAKVTPKLAYDDNVFGSDTVAVGDKILTINPQVRIESNWTTARLSLSASGQIDRFAKHSSQDSEQFDIDADGAVDVLHNLTIGGGGRYARLTEPRGGLGDAFVGGTPVIYQLASANLFTQWRPGNFDFRAGGGIATYSYDPIRLNGARVSQSYRDRREVTGSARAGYWFSPSLMTFVAASLSDIRYDNRNSGFDLNSKGYSVLVGVDFKISKLIAGNIGVGYLSQSFADPRFKDVGGLGFSGSLVWNPTPLLSVTLAGSRSVEQAGQVGVAGVVQRKVSGALDYELLRNLLIHAEVGTANEVYRGIDRQDNLVTANLNARYLANRHLHFTLAYERRDQSSSGASQRAFTENRVELSATFQP